MDGNKRTIKHIRALFCSQTQPHDYTGRDNAGAVRCYDPTNSCFPQSNILMEGERERERDMKLVSKDVSKE